MKIEKKLALVVCLGVAGLVGCQSPEQKAVNERLESQEEIQNAERKVVATEAEARARIARESDPEERAEEKVEATKDIAEAERKLDEEKIEATEEITDADVDAGRGGTFQRE